jgi:hypothetical protein
LKLFSAPVSVELVFKPGRSFEEQNMALLSYQAKQLIKRDLIDWYNADGVHHYSMQGGVMAVIATMPQFAPDTIELVDSQTNGRLTNAINLANATTIDWAQLLATLLPILMQILPMIIALFTGQPVPTPTPTPTPTSGS